MLVSTYGILFCFLFGIGVWLVLDFKRERDRTLENISQLTLHKSQLMSRSLEHTFLATDYVLRDVLGRIDAKTDLVYPDNDPDRADLLYQLLEEKLATVPGLTDLVLLDRDCRFTAAVKYQPLDKLLGRRSNQRFCSERSLPAGESLRIEYIPMAKSASRRPVVLMSRIVVSTEGSLLGGVMAVIDLEYAQNWISKFEINTHEVLAIIDTNGVLLARNPFLPDALGKRSQLPIALSKLSETRDVATFLGVSPFDSRDRIYSVSKLERFPLITVVGFDKSLALLGWQRRAWQFIGAFACLVVLSLAVLRAHMQTLYQREDMHRLAITDPLTGIANRRHLMTVGAKETAHAKRHIRPLSVLMLDIDHFKTINDTWGHATGDRVIQEIANTITSGIRKQDTCGRLGGEEFAAILLETDLSEALVIAERLRAAVQKSQQVAADDQTRIRFSVSIGVATLGEDDGSFEAILHRADEALYEAKAKGRNRVVPCAFKPHH